jgi:YHS domain-containing protein
MISKSTWIIVPMWWTIFTNLRSQKKENQKKTIICLIADISLQVDGFLLEKINIMAKQTLIILSLILIALPAVSIAQSSEVYIVDDKAIGGYDPVAFFKESRPVQGKKEFTYSYNGATWYFSSMENLEAFKGMPIKYSPQYGGYCAYGTSKGHKAPTQPDTWTIVNDKLYFNYNQDVKKTWTMDQKNLIEKADKNWPTVKKE